MSFSNENIAAFEAQMKAMAGVLLQPTSVDLYGAGQVSIKLFVSARRANESDVTAGAVQDTQLVATIDADDWDNKAGRPPQKGDVIWWAGERHAIQRSIGTNAGGNKIFYKARLQG